MHSCGVLVLVGLALGVVSGKQMNQFENEAQQAPIPEYPAAQPKRCCVPPQWEGYLGGVIGYQPHWFSSLKTTVESLAISYDAKNQRFAMNNTVFTSKGQVHYRVIELFSQKKLYVIDANGKCKSHDLPGSFHPVCVPANATYSGPFRMGLGTESMSADSWFYQIKGYIGTFAHTVTQCIPMSEMLFGTGEGWHKVPVVSTFGYTNITAGIKTPTIFTPPKDCPASQKPFHMDKGLMQYMHNKLVGGAPVL